MNAPLIEIGYGGTGMSRMLFHSALSSFFFFILTFGGSCQKSEMGQGDQKKEAHLSQDIKVKGVDTGSLTPRERREFSSYVSKFTAPCKEVSSSIADCVNQDKACKACLPAAKLLFDSVSRGFSNDQVEQAFKIRFDPGKIQDVPVDQSPTKGPDSAPVTIVEFADFTCPHCAEMAPKLDKLKEKYGDQVRVIYKFVVLQGHEFAGPSAKAGCAAAMQNKFWAMNSKMFASQPVLSPPDLEKYAAELGLDMAKYRAAVSSAECEDRIARDRKLAEQLQVTGTPTLYINGRRYEHVTDLEGWIESELTILDSGSGAGASPKPSSQTSSPSVDSGLGPKGSVARP